MIETFIFPEIQVVVAAKADADGTQETTNGSITCLTTALSGGLGEGVTPTKPGQYQYYLVTYCKNC